MIDDSHQILTIFDNVGFVEICIVDVSVIGQCGRAIKVQG